MPAAKIEGDGQPLPGIASQSPSPVFSEFFQVSGTFQIVKLLTQQMLWSLAKTSYCASPSMRHPQGLHLSASSHLAAQGLIQPIVSPSWMLSIPQGLGSLPRQICRRLFVVAHDQIVL
jgi:hypothetical protein